MFVMKFSFVAVHIKSAHYRSMDGHCIRTFMVLKAYFSFIEMLFSSQISRQNVTRVWLTLLHV